MKTTLKQQRTAFTRIELLVVIFLLMVLAICLLPRFSTPSLDFHGQEFA
jgi:competence protein ComGC